MFSAAARTLMRRTAAASVAGGASAFLLSTPQFPLYCDTKSGISIDVGKKFIQLYFAEHADAKGTIDLSKSLNYSQARQILVAAGGKEKDVKRMFDMMDTDNSNSVDFVEVCAYFCDNAVGALSEKASFFFHACDVDGSGTIEATELKTVIYHMMLLKKETSGNDSFMLWDKVRYADIPHKYIYHLQANELVAAILDKNSRDGQISEKQFQQWMVRGGKEVNQLKGLFGM